MRSRKSDRRNCRPGTQMVRPFHCDLKWPLTFNPVTSSIIIIILIFQFITRLLTEKKQLNMSHWQMRQNLKSYPYAFTIQIEGLYQIATNSRQKFMPKIFLNPQNKPDTPERCKLL